MMARRLPVRAFAGELQPKRNNARESAACRSTVYKNATCKGNARKSTTQENAPRRSTVRISGLSFDSMGLPAMIPHRDGSYELLSVCVEALTGINAELSGVDLFFQQRNDTIFNGTFLLCLRIEHSYVVGGGEADNV